MKSGDQANKTGKILQFGTGRFLRGFFAPIVANERSITVVQSRPGSSGAADINSQPCGYHVWTRGIEKGKVVDRFELVKSIDKALVAQTDWSELNKVACDTDLQLIVSNTTAAGMQLEDQDIGADFGNECPASFPAKIAALLFLRFKKGLSGLTMLPMELVDQNGDTLKKLVIEQAENWQQTNNSEFVGWLDSDNRWLNNLVDRIVVRPSDQPPWSETDQLAVVAEPFRMLAIEDDGKDQSIIPKHDMVIWTDDLQPYFKRKVRILNGLHTAMVAHLLPKGFETVLQCVTDSEARAWLDEVLFEEILPTLKAGGSDEEAFARDVMERFENPFFKHRLSDIAQGHETKLAVRIQPTVDEFVAVFGKPPEKLIDVLSSAHEFETN